MQHNWNASILTSYNIDMIEIEQTWRRLVVNGNFWVKLVTAVIEYASNAW